MFPPEVGERATMLEGDLDDVTGRLFHILEEAGALG
jgi:hypothetical protein